jgi:hypothetical protein
MAVIPRYDPPIPQTPLVDETGSVTPAWLMYFIGAQRFWTAALVSLGITPQNLQNPPQVAGDAAAEAAARTAADAFLTAQLGAEAAARASADITEAGARDAADRALRLAIFSSGSSTAVETAARIAADTTERAARIAGDATAGRVYAPLCTGDVPPVLIGTVDGQAIMVAIT